MERKKYKKIYAPHIQKALDRYGEDFFVEKGLSSAGVPKNYSEEYMERLRNKDGKSLIEWNKAHGFPHAKRNGEKLVAANRKRWEKLRKEKELKKHNELLKKQKQEEAMNTLLDSEEVRF